MSYINSPRDLLPLGAFLALGYSVLQIVRWRPGTATLASGILVILACYIILKRFSFVQPLVGLHFPYLTLGLSYILFRMLQLIVDVQAEDSSVGRVGVLTFFRFTCNFLTFVSGPIQRYQDFAAADGREAVPLDADRGYIAFARIVKGYGKFIIIAASADYLLNNISPILLNPDTTGFARLVSLHIECSIAYTIYLYFNFSGYMDIVIGVGVLLGQQLPENFDKPFSARSFLEFWQRWHMTLSNWFRTYLFNPLLLGSMAAVPAPSMTAALGVFAFFVTFLVMGIWHGTTLVCVVYGLLMGAGASINKVWQIVCTKQLGKKRYRSLSQTMLYIYIARGLTCAYFAQTLTYLWVPDFGQYVALSKRLGVSGECVTYLVLTVGAAVLSLVWERLLSISAHRAAWRPVTSLVVYRNLALSGQIIAIAAVGSLLTKAPEFIYRAF